jgi:acetyltransferase
MTALLHKPQASLAGRGDGMALGLAVATFVSPPGISLPPRPSRPPERPMHTWAAADGTSVLVRPIEPDDFELEREFVAGLSRRTRYQRLMSARTPQVAELHRWTRIDAEREGALIATVDSDGHERQIGVARYAMDDVEDEAEFAIVIDDAWQGRGLGAHLLSALIDLARRSGLRRVYGTTFSENKAMLGLARHLGFRLSLEPGAGFLTGLSLELFADA